MHTENNIESAGFNKIVVTQYLNARHTQGVKRTLAQCLEFIKTDLAHAARIMALRPLYAEAERLRLVFEREGNGSRAAYLAAKEAYDTPKQNLPAFTASGTFKRRAIDGLDSYSGLLQADFDHLGAKGVDLADLRARAEIDPHVLFSAVSPSGDGLKLFFHVDSGVDDHGAAFLGMQRYCLATYGIEPDGACKDVSRLCFLPSDPELHVNERLVPLDWRAWPEPEALNEDDDSINLPLDALPQVIRELATSCAEVYQVDPALPAVAALTIMAAALGKTVSCSGAVNGRTTPCNLMTVIVAPSGYGKGVVAVVGRPVTDASAEMVRHYEQFIRPGLRTDITIAETQKKDILASFKGAKLTGAERDSARTKLRALEIDIERWVADFDQPPALYVGSATGAALGVALERNGEQLLSFALEAGDAIRVAGGRYAKDAKADYDLLLSGYTGEPFTEARITRLSVRLDAPCLSVLWACQPSLCAELFGTAEAQERGLLARLNVVRCDDDVAPFDDGVIRCVPEALAEEWDLLIRAALELRKDGRKVTFQAARDAAEVFRIFHNESVALRNGEGRESEAKLKRCRENAIRIATVIAAAEWLAAGGGGDEPTLTAEHAARGVAWAQYFLDQTFRLTRGAVQEKRQARFAELLKLVAEAGGNITLRRLRDHHGFGETELRQIVERNSETLKIETRESNSKGGRPSPRLVAIQK